MAWLESPRGGWWWRSIVPMLGWRVVADDEYPRWVDVVPPEGDRGPVALACQAVPDFRAPSWPDGPVPAQVHLDSHVDSIADAEPAVLAAGARRHDYQSSPVQPSPDGRFVVYLDQVGHLFWLCME